MIDKEKLRKMGKELVGATGEALTMTAPILLGTAVYNTGNPKLGATIALTTIPWNAGRMGYYYIKGRRKK